MSIRTNSAQSAYDPTKPFNEHIRALIRTTHFDKGPFITTPEGKRFKTEIDPDFVRTRYKQDANDGIGTKAWIHYQMNTEHHGAKDAFCMFADDLIEGGYTPRSFLDHIQMQEENGEKILRIMNALVTLAKANHIAITGGETAIINTLKGFEVGISGEGYVLKGHQIGKAAKPGDLIIGIESSGLHSNGYTFVRDILLRKYDLLDKTPWHSNGKTIGEELTIPTRLYLPAIKKMLREFTGSAERANHYIHSMVHITGGGLSKLSELIPKDNPDIDIIITKGNRLHPQPIYQFMKEEFAIPTKDMYLKFNNGIGYVIAIDPRMASYALDILREYYPAEVIGTVEKGTGKILIASKYDSETMQFP